MLPPIARAFPSLRSRGAARLARVARRRLLLLFLLYALFLPRADLLPAKRLDYALIGLAAPYHFDLWAWEVNSLASKARSGLFDPRAGLKPSQQSLLVRRYVATAQRIGWLEDEIARLYADPAVADPATAASRLRDELAILRREQAARRPTAEAILEAQVAAVLADEKITWMGVVWPPVRFAFAEPSSNLIISPRERIVTRLNISLRAGIPLADQIRLEQQAEALSPNLSALVEGIGGFGSFPTMVIDRASLDWILNTIAHEWTHNYLIFHPLGWRYGADRDATTLNETVASIVGDEIGARALERFYPDLTPIAPPYQGWQPPPRDEKRFDFGAEMRATRLAVDTLLAGGYVREAEAFMEARRRLFVANGHSIRRLNQAYFAFHGSYATRAGAVDPIGPKLRMLRVRSGSLAEFLRVAARITDVASLDAQIGLR